MSSDYQIDIDAQALEDAQLELETLAEEEEKIEFFSNNGTFKYSNN